VSPDQLLLLTAASFVIAAVSATVGHAGASGYLAVMALLGMAPEEMRPVALMLNVTVSAIGTFQFRRAGHFSWELFFPLAAASIPYAWIGGYATLPGHVFERAAGAALLLAAVRFLTSPPPETEAAPPSFPAALAVGGWVGLLSGITGTGGGVFLNPILIFLHWAGTKTASAVTAPFILVNSLSGLFGYVSSSGRIPPMVTPLLVAAAAGGVLGSWYGSSRLDPMAVKRVLGLLLLVAGGKLLFS
jgi:uncharacterized membrane protein YfcA